MNKLSGLGSRVLILANAAGSSTVVPKIGGQGGGGLSGSGNPNNAPNLYRVSVMYLGMYPDKIQYSTTRLRWFYSQIS